MDGIWNCSNYQSVWISDLKTVKLILILNQQFPRMVFSCYQIWCIQYLIINPQLCLCVVRLSKPNGWTDLDETLHVHSVWPNSGSLLGFELIFDLVCYRDHQGPHYCGWQKSPSVTNRKSPSVTNLKNIRLSLTSKFSVCH